MFPKTAGIASRVKKGHERDHCQGGQMTYKSVGEIMDIDIPAVEWKKQIQEISEKKSVG